MNDAQSSQPLQRHPLSLGRFVEVLPVVAIVSLYTLIAYSWVVKAIDAVASASTDHHFGESVLFILHALSTAVFFASVGMITLVRHRPIWRQQRLLGWILPSVVMVSMAVVGNGQERDLPLALMICSSALVMFGTVFTLYALKHLGKHFGVISDVRGLVTTGPYSHVRHPLYAGETISMVGLLMLVFSPLTLAAFVVGLSLQIWRAKVEEQSLSTVFPEYKAYASRTPMIIPFARVPARAWIGVRTAE